MRRREGKLKDLKASCSPSTLFKIKPAMLAGETIPFWSTRAVGKSTRTSRGRPSKQDGADHGNETGLSRAGCGWGSQVRLLRAPRTSIVAFVAQRVKCVRSEASGHELGAQAAEGNLSLQRDVGGKLRSTVLGEFALSPKIYDPCAFS